MPGSTKPGPITNPNLWKVVLYDEFNGSSLDLNSWSYNYPTDWPHDGHTHNHQAYMNESNVIIENGILRLMGENEKHPDAPEPEWAYNKWLTYNFTSGVIHSKDKFNFTRGYIEGSFRMPNSKGFWPAFWMLNNNNDGPPEIDILEVLTNQPKILYTAFHYGNSWAELSSFGQAHAFLPNLGDDFHTYGLEWSKDALIWFFDGRQVGRAFKKADWINTCQDMYILINLAIGGWAENPDDSTIWPAYYDCEFVKVWQMIA